MATAQAPDIGIARGTARLERAAFECFPYGILVVDGDGRVVSRNAEAAHLIEARGLSSAHVTCCELFGCRVSQTVLAGACITELALARGEPLPEVRVDVKTLGGEIKALWVLAAPLRGYESHVVMQLRPGSSTDRRRRTDPHWMSGPRLQILALGRTSVEAFEGPIGGEWLNQRTGQLLKYLIAERHRSVHVDEIGENVWPKADFAVATNVRYYVHALRSKLEPGRRKRAPSNFIVSCGGGYRLNLDRVTVDADQFERHTSAGLAALESDPQTADVELEAGLALYRGDFLADLPYADWAMPERHRLHDLACIALRNLGDLRLKRRKLDRAARSFERLAAMQPYDELVHRQLIELDIARGHKSDAIRRYTELRSRMRRTFGHDPEFTLADLTIPRA
jgi:DNA-binding SARP family transcriptional activator